MVILTTYKCEYCGEEHYSKEYMEIHEKHCKAERDLFMEEDLYYGDEDIDVTPEVKHWKGPVNITRKELGFNGAYPASREPDEKIKKQLKSLLGENDEEE